MKTLNKAQIEGLGDSLQPLGRTARIFKLQGALMPLVEDALNTVFKAAQDEYGKTGDISPERDAQRIELIRVTALMIATQVFDAPPTDQNIEDGEPKMIQIDDQRGEVELREFIAGNFALDVEQIPENYVAYLRSMEVGEVVHLNFGAGGITKVRRTR